MKRFLFPCVFLTFIVALCVAQSVGVKLGFPKPNYHAEKDDPAWVTMATQFHGHLGPAIIFGCRVGMTALDEVGAQGYFDVEVTAQGPFAMPPKSCVLDGLQLSTGATLGKRNLHIVIAEEYVITVKNKRTGVSVEIRPTPELIKLMWSRLEPDNHDEDTDTEMRRVEAVARQIANMPQEKMMMIKKNP